VLPLQPPPAQLRGKLLPTRRRHGSRRAAGRARRAPCEAGGSRCGTALGTALLALARCSLPARYWTPEKKIVFVACDKKPKKPFIAPLHEGAAFQRRSLAAMEVASGCPQSAVANRAISCGMLQSRCCLLPKIRLRKMPGARCVWPASSTTSSRASTRLPDLSACNHAQDHLV
jgi:hypothetical protein